MRSGVAYAVARRAMLIDILETKASDAIMDCNYMHAFVILLTVISLDTTYPEYK